MDEKVWDLFFDNSQKILFPETWLVVDSTISKMELVTLLFLWKNGETIMTQLADSVNIPMSTATGVVNRLTKNGYVERFTDEANRRIVTVRLTQKGIDAAESFKQAIIKYWDTFTDVLTDKEKQVIFKLLVKAIGLLGKIEVENAKYKQPITKIDIE